MKVVSSLVEAQFWSNKPAVLSPLTEVVYLQTTCDVYTVYFCQIYNTAIFSASNQELTVERNIYKCEELLQEGIGFQEQQPYGV